MYFQILNNGYESERLLGTPKCRWENNIKLDFKEIGYEVLGCIHLAQGRDQWKHNVNTLINSRIPQKVENLLS
jgi:hypothetical protein